MLESALKSLEDGGLTRTERDSAIGVVAQFVEENTRTVAVLPDDATGKRITKLLIRLFDEDESNLPLSTLIWTLGKIHDPSLETHFKRWLRRYVIRLKSHSAAIHNTLINLDRLTGNHRSASLLDIEENVRRAEQYIGEAIPW